MNTRQTQRVQNVIKQSAKHPVKWISYDSGTPNCSVYRILWVKVVTSQDTYYTSDKWKCLRKANESL